MLSVIKNHFFTRLRLVDLQTKVILILIAVIFPISFILGVVQSRAVEPVLYDEIRQIGVSFAQSLANQIESQRLLIKPNPTSAIEDRIQRMMYAQPSVIRVDVIHKAPIMDRTIPEHLEYLASSLEDQSQAVPPIPTLKTATSAEITHEEDIPVWSVYYPVKTGSEVANVHVLTSLRFATAVQGTTFKINMIGAFLSTIFLILVLSFFLKRAIENEKQLKVAQLSNEVLSGRLQEIQQELLHTEKLAVMGQLTASFAHEIGTPLNAINGHMQLLNMDLDKTVPEKSLGGVSNRIGIITSQIKKIEDIVKGFLQTTKKPIAQQKSIVPVHELVDGILALVIPTLQRYQISFGTDYVAKNEMIEVVPLEIEQVLLNLVNNAMDSMKEREAIARAKNPHSGKQSVLKNALWLRTSNDADLKWVNIEIEDTGTGISDEILKQIFKPFFTTKSAGEGHGLGLSICQQIVRSYGGDIVVESLSQKGSDRTGTRMKVQIPMANPVSKDSSKV
jgi:signal transduction histidine kinase